MVRILGWLALVSVLGYGVMQMADYRGVLKVQWLGYEIETSFVVAALLTMALVFGFAVLVSMMEAVLSVPMRMKHRKAQGQHREGIGALTQAFTALALADVDAAAKHTRRAEQLLGSEPLVDLLGAQVAHKQGDDALTVQKLERLSQHKATHYIATRALLKLAMRAENPTQALNYAEKTAKDQPKNAKAQVMRIGLLLRLARWQEAERLIFQSRIKMVFSKALAERLYALTYYLKAHEHHAASLSHDATTLPLAKAAHQHQVGFVPAAVLAAQLYAQHHDMAQAHKIIRKCWKVAPHPQLTSVFMSLIAGVPYEKSVKKCDALVGLHPAHRESILLKARVSMAYQRWDEARTALMQLLAQDEAADVYTLLAELEQLQYPYQQQHVAADMLRKAASAPVAAAWVCRSCGHVSAHWEAFCGSCDGFDTSEWTQPNVSQSADASLLLLG